MKKTILSIAALLLTLTAGAQSSDCSKKCCCCSQNQDAPTVYVTRDLSPESIVKIYHALGRKAEGRVAIKISTGESEKTGYLRPAMLKPLIDDVASVPGNTATIVECNTAYGGLRSTTSDHLQTARDHGFSDLAEVDIMDAEGEFTIPVRDTSYLKYDIVGNNLKNYDFLVNLAHFKGHAMGGFGGVLKNQSIGIASANGKAYQHSTGKYQTVDEFQNAITKMIEEDPAKAATCWVDITHSHDAFHECMANCAAAIADYFGEGKVIYINVMNNLSVDCDCDAHPAEPEMNDVGILASLDPVALDQACVDLVFNYPSTDDDNAAALIERINSRHGIHTIEHAQAIGLGTRKYNLVNIDE